MGDSSEALPRIQLEAIKNGLLNGTISPAEIHRILLSEIQKELNKPVEQINMTYVSECEKLLEVLNHSRSVAFESHYDSNYLIIQKKLRNKHKARATINRLRYGFACCLIVLLVFGDVIFSGREFSITTSPDNELMIIQGMEDDRNAQSQVDQNTTSGYLVTESREEAIAFYGEVPATPSWIPSSFSIQSYHVNVLEAYKTFTILYINTVENKTLVYSVRDYSLIELARQEIEQNNNEETRIYELSNGSQVFVTSNYLQHNAIWTLLNSLYTIYGDIPENDIVKIAESVSE